jgi:hypothetical protein
MKTNSNRLLRLVSTVLKFLWYGNILLIVLILSFLTTVYCTSEFTRVSIPIAAIQKEYTKLGISSHAYGSITLGASQKMLNIELKNTLGNMALSYFFVIATQVLIMIIIYQLRKFFTAIEEKAPFNYINVRRLKITALCFALFTVIHILFGLTLKFIIEQNVKDSENIHLVWSESFFGPALGAALYILADVFRYGFELQKENEEFV